MVPRRRIPSARLSVSSRLQPANPVRSSNGGGNVSALIFTTDGPLEKHGQRRRVREFPLDTPGEDESETVHLHRVARRVDAVIAAGGTHLLIPPERLDWLVANPLVTEYFAQHHAVAEASAESGIVLALRSDTQTRFAVEVDGWTPRPGPGCILTAERRLVDPRLTLRPMTPPRGRLRGRLRIAAAGVRTIRVAFLLTRSDRLHARRREVTLSLQRPGSLFHDLPYLRATFHGSDEVELEFDLALEGERSLERIALELVEEDNWRLHPSYPDGHSIAIPAAVAPGARIELRDVALDRAETIRRAPAWGVVAGDLPVPYRKPPGRPRDAVLFSSWVPEAGLALGDFFIEMLRRWHADSKIFVGVNHGSSAKWTQRLAASGLDVTIRHAPPTMTMACDPAGFVAALDAYRRHEEAFELVWFGHTKGMSHLDETWYATGRWTIERTLWSRREAIERHFADPTIGLYAPHYLMFLEHHHEQTDALQRIYRGVCRPLGAMAVSTHYVMREESVRAFCRQVDRRFFQEGPGPFGGDKYFFEMAMPNVPIMQGYEPYIEPGFGGTSGPPPFDGIASVLNDWRQNNAVVAHELEKWRQNPARFRSRHREHICID